MPNYVYIIQSLADKSYYKGFTENPILRIQRHNNGESTYTSAKCPWVLVYVEIFETKKEALKREIRIKKYSHDQIELLIQSAKNIVQQFMV